MNEGDVLERPEEVARRLRRPPSFLAKARSAGSGPPFLKVGGLIRYRRSDVDAWLQGCVRSVTTGARRTA
jgi:hypothetical protein